MTKETIKDAQKKTLTAMANVNAVDGFDPRLVTSCFQDAEVTTACISRQSLLCCGSD